MKHVPLKTALAALFMAGTTFTTAATAAAEAAGSAPKNPAHVEITLRPGNTRSIGEADLFIPLFQDTQRMFFADLRVVRDTVKNTEGNFGLGYRHIMNNRYILGVYGFFDARRTRYHQTVYGATFGAEVMTCNFEARINGYFPQKKSKRLHRHRHTGFVQRIIGQISHHRRQHEVAMTGFDAEVGAKIPTPGFKNLELRVFGGGYYFAGRRHVKNITGPRGRIEARFNDVFTPGSRITVGFEVSNDRRCFKASEHSRNRTHFFGQVGLRIPLQWKSMRVATGLQRRLAEYVKRDVDIVTGITGKVHLKHGDLHRAVASAIGPDGNLLTAFHVDAKKAAARLAKHPNLVMDGTYENPFASDADLQAFFANPANAAIVNVPDIAIVHAADQTYNVPNATQIDMLAANNQRNSVYYLAKHGPDTLTGQLVKVHVKNGAVVKRGHKGPFTGEWLHGKTGAVRPILNGVAGGVATTTNLNFFWYGVNATAANNAATLVNVTWNNAGSTFTGYMRNANLAGSATSANGLMVMTGNNAIGTFNVGNDGALVAPVSSTGFTAGNAFNFNSTGASSLTTNLVNVSGGTSNVGLLGTAQGTSTLTVTTDGNSTFNNNVMSGINLVAQANTKGIFTLNNTTVDTTTTVGAAAVTNTNAAVRIEGQGVAGSTTNVTINTNGLTVNNAASRGMLVVATGLLNPTVFNLNITNSKFNNTQSGAVGFNLGTGLTLQTGDMVNVSAANFSGNNNGSIVNNNTFNGNTRAGLQVVTGQSNISQTIGFTGNTFTNNNTAGVAAGGEVVISSGGAGATATTVVANNVFNFTNTNLTPSATTFGNGFVLAAARGATPGTNTVNWSGGTITGNASMNFGGIFVVGYGVTANSARFNLTGGLQVTGFTNAGAAGKGFGVGLNGAGAPASAVFNLGTTTAGTGAGQVSIFGNNVGANMGVSAPIGGASGTITSTAGPAVTTAAGVIANYAPFFTPNTTVAVN